MRCNSLLCLSLVACEVAHHRVDADAKIASPTLHLSSVTCFRSDSSGVDVRASSGAVSRSA